MKTIGELKTAIQNIPDDFTLKLCVSSRLPEETLKAMKYPCPYQHEYTNIDLNDIGYSEKTVVFGIDLKGI